MSREATNWSDRWLGTFRSLSSQWARALDREARKPTPLFELRLQRGHLTACWGSESSRQSTAILWRPLGPGVWEGLLRAWKRDPSRRAMLLEGRLPPAAAEDLRARRQTLLPRRARDLLASCDCGGSNDSPCSHLAALCTAFAGRMVAEPQLLLHFRGLEPAILAESLGGGGAPETLHTGARQTRSGAASPLPTDRWRDPLSLDDRKVVQGQGMRVLSLEGLAMELDHAPPFVATDPTGSIGWWSEVAK